jgi:glucose dehydrogenase
VHLVKTAALFLSIGLSMGARLAHAQPSSKAGEWPTYGADLANTRYRPLDQIDASNFGKLEVAWHFKTDSIGNRPEYNWKARP